jgi:hypothetical protein
VDVQDIVKTPPFVLSELIAVNDVRFRILGNLPQTYLPTVCGALGFYGGAYWHFQAKGYNLIFLTFTNSRFAALKSNSNRQQSSKGWEILCDVRNGHRPPSIYCYTIELLLLVAFNLLT